jgi:PhzF family phenazine biosynthesis protein
VVDVGICKTLGVRRRFEQVDVFSSEALGGNPVAVVLDADGLDGETMQRLAGWTNLSETTFVSAPTVSGADYRVQIFTPLRELPFAGHPTLGTCHAWSALAGADSDRFVQECAAGLVDIRRIDGRLAFAAPPLVRSGPVDEPLIGHLADVLGITRGEILDAQWVDNGPGWVAVLLADADAVLAVRPGPVDLDIGVAGLRPADSGEALEVRAFFPKDGTTIEDPVTGSLNASLAEWLIRDGKLNAPYVARQGTALNRAGRVFIDVDASGRIWVGGATCTRIEGHLEL